MAQSRLVDEGSRSELVDVVSEHVDSDPEVGVSLLNYNGWEDTIGACESVLGSTSMPVLLTIVENGSGEVEKKSLRSALDERATVRNQVQLECRTGTITGVFYTWEQDASVLLLDSDVNLGFCAGNNLAVECFDYFDIPFSLVLNNDAELRDGCLDRLHRTIQEFEDVVAVSPVIYDFEDDLWYAGGTYSPWHYQYKDNFEADGEGYVGEIQTDSPYRTKLYSGACVLFDTGVYCSEGGMYDPLFISIDEPEFSRHLREQDHGIAVEPRAEAVHRRNQSLGEAGSTYHDYFYVRNSLIYSYVQNSHIEHAAFFLRQFVNYLRPFLSTESGARSDRAGTGIEAILDYFDGKWGPGRMATELNATSLDDSLWDPESEWNRGRR